MFPDFKERASGKIGLKLGKAQFSRALSGHFLICRLMVRMSPFHHSDSKYILLSK